MPRTPYTETEFLLAVMEDNTEEAERLAGQMTAREQRALVAHLRTGVRFIEHTDALIL